jgi:hypothetical protein
LGNSYHASAIRNRIQLMATALVLLASITVDVEVRRRGETAR